MGSMYRKFTLAIKQRYLNPLYAISVITFFVEIGNFRGEDIVNARENYTSGGKIDFWGGISTLIYSNIPDFYFRWQVWLGLTQIILATLGLRLILDWKHSVGSKRILLILISYLSLIFSAQMTRDGLMFSILLLGFGLLIESYSRKRTTAWISGSVLVICVGMSFRPWLSVAIVPLVLAIVIRKKIVATKKLISIIIMVLTVLPIILEFSASKSLMLVKSYPQQQVMIMDMATTFCHTNNSRSGKTAKDALLLFTSDQNFPKVACQLFRTDTWLSLTRSGNESSKDITSDFWLIQPGETQKYESLKSKWVEIILTDPVSYLQNKITFASKLIIGSDTRGFSITSAQTTREKIVSVYKFPFEVAITFHLLSVLLAIIFITFIPFTRLANGHKSFVELDRFTLSLLASLSLWVIFSSIAYIGSNGRYSYSITLITICLYLQYLQSTKIYNVND
jgi:hypothetical protein